MDPRLPSGLVCFLAALLVSLVAFPGAQGQDGDYRSCYSFTWTGKNVSVDCEEHKVDILDESQPCLSTLVYTDKPDQPPNITDLNNHCQNVAWCPPYTCKKKKNCVKLMWYDITNTMVNYSAFCGFVIDKTDPTNPGYLESGVLEMQVGTFRKKVMVCNSDFCNAAGVLRSPGGVALVAVALVPFIVSMLLSPESSFSSSSFSFLSPVAASLLFFFKR